MVFLGWFGPRGLASILFAIIALEEAHEADLGPMFVVMSWTVLFSIVLHGISADPAVARYGAWFAEHGRHPEADGSPMPESEPMPRQRTRRQPRS